MNAFLTKLWGVFNTHGVIRAIRTRALLRNTLARSSVLRQMIADWHRRITEDEALLRDGIDDVKRRSQDIDRMALTAKTAAQKADRIHKQVQRPNFDKLIVSHQNDADQLKQALSDLQSDIYLLANQVGQHIELD